MIFETNSIKLKTDESYKERNLYCKIFAGYLFNELIPNYEVRKITFFKILQEKIYMEGRFFGDKAKAEILFSDIQKVNFHVTFDYHTAQIFKEDKKDNRGEMSDILLLSSNHILSIECKYLSNINFKKDIHEVQQRIVKFSNHFNLKPLQILLLKREKWNNTKRIRKELEKRPSVDVIVLFWDDLFPIIENREVKIYLEMQLTRKNKI